MHYHFTSKPDMEKEIADGQFLEHAHVHGNIYGTSVAAVREVAANGKCCILDIDVQGARQARCTCRSATAPGFALCSTHPRTNVLVAAPSQMGPAIRNRYSGQCFARMTEQTLMLCSFQKPSPTTRWLTVLASGWLHRCASRGCAPSSCLWRRRRWRSWRRAFAGVAPRRRRRCRNA